MDALTGRVLAVVPDRQAERRIRKELPETEVVFADLTSAVEVATRSRPDVIVIDVSLPGDDGFRMLQKLGQQKETRDAEIVWVSASKAGHASTSPPIQSDLDKLQDAVADLLRKRRMYETVREAVERADEQAAVAPTALTLDERRALESGGAPIGGHLAVRPLAARAAKYYAIVEGSLTTEEAATRLGVSTGRIRQRLLADPPTLYGIRDGNVWRLPAFQFRSRALVPNIDRVIARLDPSLDPVAVENWFRQPQVDLDQDGHLVSPLDWLAQGRSAQPVEALAEDL